MIITNETYPAAYAAMDAAAAAYWAYPCRAWQDEFLAMWARAHNDAALEAAVTQSYPESATRTAPRGSGARSRK